MCIRDRFTTASVR